MDTIGVEDAAAGALELEDALAVRRSAAGWITWLYRVVWEFLHWIMLLQVRLLLSCNFGHCCCECCGWECCCKPCCCTVYSTYMLVPVYADAAGVVDMCFCWFYVCRYCWCVWWRDSLKLKIELTMLRPIVLKVQFQNLAFKCCIFTHSYSLNIEIVFYSQSAFKFCCDIRAHTPSLNVYYVRQIWQISLENAWLMTIKLSSMHQKWFADNKKGLKKELLTCVLLRPYPIWKVNCLQGPFVPQNILCSITVVSRQEIFLLYKPVQLTSSSPFNIGQKAIS